MGVFNNNKILKYIDYEINELFIIKLSPIKLYILISLHSSDNLILIQNCAIFNELNYFHFSMSELFLKKICQI